MCAIIKSEYSKNVFFSSFSCEVGDVYVTLSIYVVIAVWLGFFLIFIYAVAIFQPWKLNLQVGKFAAKEIFLKGD